MELLTGKCKEDFEKWFYANEVHLDICELEFNYQKSTVLDVFQSLPLSMQYGVLVDFFDSVGISIEIQYMYNYYEALIFYNEWHHVEESINRIESRIEAIKKANQLYNEQHK